MAMVLISETHNLNRVFSPIQIAERAGKMVNMNARAAIDVRRIFLGQQNDFHTHSFFYTRPAYTIPQRTSQILSSRPEP
jgi:hypothetical protein